MRPSVEPESLDVPAPQEVADALTLHTCLRNCYGIRDMAVSCCTVGERDYIIGPIRDAEAFLERLGARFGRPFTHDEVFIGYEEGRALFPDRPCWQMESCYPAIRPDLDAPARPCRFLGAHNLCTVHDIRPATCAAYFCPHLQGLLDAL